MNQTWLNDLREALSSGKPFATITIVETWGSSPRKPGAKMIAYGDGSIRGTVGGGSIEHSLLRDAAVAITDGNPVLKRYELADIKMKCGGGMVGFIEPSGVGHNVVVLGAGHVCRALAPLLVRLGFRLTVVDDRPEWADPAAFPEGVSVRCSSIEDAAASLPEDLSGHYVLVMTRGHGLDFEAAKRFAGRKVRYLGVMASRKKALELRKTLKEEGFKPGDIARVRMPVGVSIGSSTPDEIAVSIAAELISVRSETA